MDPLIIELDQALNDFSRRNIASLPKVEFRPFEVLSETQHLGQVQARPSRQLPRNDAGNEQALVTGPHIDSVDPDHGTIDGGTVVTLHGTGLFSDAHLKIEFIHRLGNGQTYQQFNIGTTDPNGLFITFTTTSSVEFGIVDVKFTNGIGTDTKNDAYTYVGIKIYAIDPNVGPIEGGNTVTVYGENFGPVTLTTGLRVYFGSGYATDIVVALDGKSATCKPPSHVAGSVDVYVKNIEQGDLFDTLPLGYTYGGGVASVVMLECDVTGDGTNYFDSITLKSGVTYPVDVYALSQVFPRVVNTSYNGSFLMNLAYIDTGGGPVIVATSPPLGSSIHFVSGHATFLVEALITDGTFQHFFGLLFFDAANNISTIVDFEVHNY